jgi:hypothetical protein
MTSTTDRRSTPTKRARKTTWISAMDRRDLDAVWTVLGTQLPISGIEVAETGFSITAGPVLAGIDSERRRYLLIPLVAGEAARTDTRGRAVHVTRIAHGGAHFLAIVCLASDLHPVFTQFARELVVSVDAAPSPARAAIEAFDRWRALFSDAALRGALGVEKLVGLMGELLTLEGLLDAGAPSDLQYWCGPSGHQHDFRSPRYGLEAKATLVREGRIVGISSVDQLETPPGIQLWLVLHRLDRDPGGFNIAEVVDRILALGCSQANLVAGLRAIGVDLDLSLYTERRFRLVESLLYDVGSVAFPRITRSNFVGGDVPPGTLRISYSIDLTNRPPDPLTSDDADRVYSMIAKDARYGMGS